MYDKIHYKLKKMEYLISENGHEFEQTPWDSEEEGSLAFCSPWGHRELEMTYQLNNNN